MYMSMYFLEGILKPATDELRQHHSSNNGRLDKGQTTDKCKQDRSYSSPPGARGRPKDGVSAGAAARGGRADYRTKGTLEVDLCECPPVMLSNVVQPRGRMEPDNARKYIPAIEQQGQCHNPNVPNTNPRRRALLSVSLSLR